MLKTNEKQLVKIAVEGKVAPAMATPNRVGHDGFAYSLPAVGSITYNVRVGDPAFGWAADHVEPCVSTILDADRRADKPNAAYNFLACVGNEAIVVTGAAKGTRGVVTGSHGGCEHVLIDLPPKEVEKLTLDDGWAMDKSNQFAVYVTGYVTNNTDKAITNYVQITFDALDRQGANLGTCLANTNKLIKSL